MPSHIAERLDEAGADLVSLSESIDTTSAAGKMVFRMLAVLSEFERDLVSERTRAAMSHKKANGFYTGGVAPFGYDVTDDGRLVKNSMEQETIGIIQTLRADGLTLRAIAKELEDRGCESKIGNTWSPKTVRGVLARVA
jgi:DNA invertase Pin-like site-specific DNA recombinase